MKTSASRALHQTEEPEIAPSSLVARRRVLAVGEALWTAPTRTCGCPTTDDVLNTRPPVGTISEELVGRIVHVLTRPRLEGETHRDAGDNRERELISLVAELTPIQALEIGRRISANRADDVLATTFKRLLPERRSRLAHALSRRR
jgi:hypothetical protein